MLPHVSSHVVGSLKATIFPDAMAVDIQMKHAAGNARGYQPVADETTRCTANCEHISHGMN